MKIMFSTESTTANYPSPNNLLLQKNLMLILISEKAPKKTRIFTHPFYSRPPIILEISAHNCSIESIITKTLQANTSLNDTAKI